MDYLGCSTQVGSQTCSQILDKGWKCLQESTTLAYYAKVKITHEKSFIKFCAYLRWLWPSRNLQRYFFRKKNIFSHCKECKHSMFYLRHMNQVISSQSLMYTPINITGDGNTKVSTLTLSITTFSITSFTITTCIIQHFIAAQSIMPFCLLSFW